MLRHEIPEFSSEVAALHQVYGLYKPDDPTMQSWLRAFKSVPLVRFREACAEWIQTSDKMARPASLLKLLRETDPVGTRTQCAFTADQEVCPLVATVSLTGDRPLCSGHYQLDASHDAQAGYLHAVIRARLTRDPVPDWRAFLRPPA